MLLTIGMAFTMALFDFDVDVRPHCDSGYCSSPVVLQSKPCDAIVG